MYNPDYVPGNDKSTLCLLAFSVGVAIGDDGRQAVVVSLIGEQTNQQMLLILPANVVLDFQEQIYDAFAQLGGASNNNGKYYGPEEA
jgi:hypothetical protein